MTDIAVRVENLSRQYRIGGPQARYKTIRESLTDAVQAPFRRLSSVVRGQSSAVSKETIWALKDVSFDVKRGEVVGTLAPRCGCIIGRNGAGTLAPARSAGETTLLNTCPASPNRRRGTPRSGGESARWRTLRGAPPRGASPS